MARASVLALVILFILPLGTASARTTVTPRTAGHEAALLAGPPLAPPAVTLGAHLLVHFTRGVPGPTLRAGAQSISPLGVSGRTSALPACGRSPCTDNYRGAGTARLKPGDWGVEVHLTVLQPPAATGKATGFVVQVAVETTAGWTAVIAYLSTGTNPSTAAQTINLNLFADLGVTAKPTVLATDIVVSACAQAASCL